ncbi:MAG: hypothetical protein JWQ09_2189, partial [Segetibacter sp.]|nr:hypothetical protein [Segetibacter sp.]
MTFKKRSFTRLLCLCVVIGSHSFCKAQSYSYSGGDGINSQSVENQENNKTLREALSDVGKRYNVSFVYLDKLVDNKVVSNNSSNRNSNLEQELSNLLKDFNLVYRKISDKQIAILEAVLQKAEKKEEGKTKEIQTYIQQVKQEPVKGKVTSNKDNTPLPGATIT